MKISGPLIFIGVLVSATGAILGVIMLVNAFCLLSCTLVHQRATNSALAVIGISFLVLMAAIVAAINAIRRRNGAGGLLPRSGWQYCRLPQAPSSPSWY